MKWIWRGVLLCLAAMAAIAVDGLTDRPGPAETALVLGTGGIRPDGTPSERLRARLDRAAEADRARPFRFLIVSGRSASPGPDEAEVMAAYLERRGVPAARLILDHHGETTWASARFTAAFLQARGLRGATVITQYFHIPRARMALERMGVSPVYSLHAHRIEWHDAPLLAREVAAWIDYRFRTP
ncbi:MAG: YdcF family protein [Verrucomicrobium sp.]|nr:YdcF family protein [Verrucomicrobium sp.]